MIEKKFLIHTVLGHSYLFAFCMFILGLLLDHFFPNVPKNHLIDWVGLIIMGVGSLLVLWAQHTTHKSQDVRQMVDTTNPSHAHVFHKGPYKYVRVPTHIGIFLVFFGFGFIINSFFVPVMAFVAFLINKYFFVLKEEKILKERYGEPYQQYKERVKF